MNCSRQCFIGILALVAFLSVCPISFGEEQKDFSTNASLTFTNKYVFRGYELSKDSLIIQPNVTISGYGFGFSIFGNIDTSQKQTQSFLPTEEKTRKLNEVDYTANYSRKFSVLDTTIGYIYYGTDYCPHTEELFLTLSFDTLLKPTISMYRDITRYIGSYINLSLSHSFNITKEITLDVAAAFGYVAGDDEYWRTYDAQTGSYTGKMYKAFHDGMLKVGFTIPLTNLVSVQSYVQYTFPLSSKAKRVVDGMPYNPNGQLEGTFVGGITFNLSF